MIPRQGTIRRPDGYVIEQRVRDGVDLVMKQILVVVEHHQAVFADLCGELG